MSGRAPLQAPALDRYARISGVGGYRPARVVHNDELAERISSSDEWIRERTGIVTRHIAEPDETVVDMAVRAATQALEHAGLPPERLTTVIMATVTHTVQTPAAAPIVADRLGAVAAAAFDVSAACAGFCYALALANDLIRTGTAEHVLVIGAEKISDLTDPDDRGTAFIFGDGAGAAVVSPSDTPGIAPVVWGSDGSRADAIEQVPSWPQLRRSRPGEQPRWPALRMQGQAVFRWAVFSMAPVAREAIERAGLTPQQIDLFVPHQANMRIIDAMLAQLGLPESIPVARDIAQTGNTSAASVPLALRRMIDDGVARSGDRALLIGFGAGLVYAAQVVEVP